MSKTSASILYIPHGGGPLPLLGDQGHLELISFLEDIPASIPTPSTIVIISAHWETQEVCITGATNPKLLYDYSGFPKEFLRCECACLYEASALSKSFSSKYVAPSEAVINLV